MNLQRHYALEIAAQGKSGALQAIRPPKKTQAPLSRNPKAEYTGRYFSWIFAIRKARLQYQGNFYKRSQIGEADTKPPARQWTASIRGAIILYKPLLNSAIHWEQFHSGIC